MTKKKCVVCGNFIDNEADSIPYKSRYAHKKCFQSTIKIATTEKKKIQVDKAQQRKRKSTKPKVESIKEALSEEEYGQKIELYNYLRQILSVEELSTKIYVLIEDYLKKYNFTYKGIKQTLKYHFEILNNEVVGDCIGLVPYIYDKAMDYYDTIERIEKDVSNKHIENMYKIKTVRIKPKKKKVELTDIESIGIDNEDVT